MAKRKYWLAALKKMTLLAALAAVGVSAFARGDDDDDERRERKGKRHREARHHYNDYGCPPPSAQAAAPRIADARSFPRESAGERASARQRQRDILLEELATEEQLLERARRAPADRDTIDQHQRNVEALRREIAGAQR